MLRCSGVCISAHSISEIKRGKPAKSIPRERILNLKLCNDTGVRNPFCHFMLGFTLVMIGFIGDFILLVSNFEGISLVENPDPEGMVLPVIPIVFWVMVGAGMLLLVGVFHARYHLVIETEEGINRFFFEKTSGPEEIRHFLAKAGKEFGYEVDVSAIESPGVE